MAGRKARSSKTVMPGLLTMRWKKLKAAFADACAKLLAPHVLADASCVRRRQALPATPLQAKLKKRILVDDSRLAFGERVSEGSLRAVNGDGTNVEAKSSIRNIESTLQGEGEGTSEEVSEEEIDVLDVSDIVSTTSTTTSYDEETEINPDQLIYQGSVVELEIHSKQENGVVKQLYAETLKVIPIKEDDSKDRSRKEYDGLEDIPVAEVIELPNAETLGFEVDENEMVSPSNCLPEGEGSDDWHEGLQTVIEEELEDILSGLHRRLSGLHASSNHAKKVRYHSLPILSEEPTDDQGDQVSEEATEEQRLQKLNDAICNLTQQHQQRAKEIEEEKMNIADIKSTFGNLESMADDGCMKESSAETLGKSYERHEIRELQKKIAEMDIAAMEREQQFKRQREELHQLWRTSSELGQKAAAERSKAKAEKERAEKAENMLETLRISEANLAEQLKTQMHKNSQLKVAVACLYDADTKKREEELEGLVARLHAEKLEMQTKLEERSGEWELCGERLEKEVATLRKSNKLLSAKLGWMAKSKQELEEEVKDLAALINQRDLEEGEETTMNVVSPQMWTLLEELTVTSNNKSEADEFAHLKWIRDALIKEIETSKSAVQILPTKGQLSVVVPQDNHADMQKPSPFSQEEIETAEKFLRSVQYVTGGDGRKSDCGKECKGDLLFNLTRSPLASLEVVSEPEHLVSVNNSSGDLLPRVNSSSSVDKWDNSSSTSSSTFGSPNLHPRKVAPR